MKGNFMTIKSHSEVATQITNHHLVCWSEQVKCNEAKLQESI